MGNIAFPRPNTARSSRLSAILQSLMRRLRRHALALSVVLAVSVAGQALVLMWSPTVVTQPDTDSYLAVTGNALRAFISPDSIRTPGYPLFLALVFRLAGSQDLTHVVYAQVALFILSAVEIYALVYILTSRRWIGALVAALVGGNLYLANWSRIILSEPLTTWLLVSAMLCLAVYFHRPSNGALALLVAFVTASVFTRPQMLYLPAVILAVVSYRAVRQSRLKGWGRALLRQWPAIAGMAAVYGLTALYMLAFLASYGQFTTTRVANISLLGVAMRDHVFYGMPYDGVEPKYAQMRADLDRFQGPSVYVFITLHPQYDSPSGQFFGAFGAEALRAHPGYLAQGAYNNFMRMTEWDQQPSYLEPITLAPSWLLAISQDVSLAYACLPLLLLAALAGAWRNPSSPRAMILATLMLVVVAHIFTGALTDFGAFTRLRMPVDWAMLAVTVLALVQMFEWAGEKSTAPAPLGRS